MKNVVTNTESPLPGHLPFELIALEKAVRYQQWIIETIRPYLGQRILELGAGIGNMSRWFSFADRLILTEYDPTLLALLQSRAQSWFPASLSLSTCELDLSQKTAWPFENEQLDTIVSFNVLEHIEDDAHVLQRCAELLRASSAPGKKRIITFVPAHPWAYGVMDKEVGHYRRYNQIMFKKLHQQTIKDAKLILKPFNFIGLWGWAVNGRLLRRSSAGPDVISIFEKLCPYLKYVDKLIIDKIKIPLGQSLIAIQELQ